MYYCNISKKSLHDVKSCIVLLVTTLPNAFIWHIGNEKNNLASTSAASIKHKVHKSTQF